MRGLAATAIALAACATATAGAAELVAPLCAPSGEPVLITGGGFAAGAQVQLTRDGLDVARVVADGNGAFSARVDIVPVDRNTTVALGATDGASTATARTTSVLPFGELRPDRGFTGRRVTVRFRGLPAAEPAWLHVRERSRTVATYRLVKRVDGCGVQSARGRFLRRLGDLEPKANLVVNGSRRRAQARPAARLKVPVGGKVVGTDLRTGYFSFVSANWLAGG